jgi:hypothetical protein
MADMPIVGFSSEKWAAMQIAAPEKRSPFAPLRAPKISLQWVRRMADMPIVGFSSDALGPRKGGEWLDFRSRQRAAFSALSVSGLSHNECRAMVVNQKVVGSNIVCRATFFHFEAGALPVDWAAARIRPKWRAPSRKSAPVRAPQGRARHSSSPSSPSRLRNRWWHARQR